MSTRLLAGVPKHADQSQRNACTRTSHVIVREGVLFESVFRIVENNGQGVMNNQNMFSPGSVVSGDDCDAQTNFFELVDENLDVKDDVSDFESVDGFLPSSARRTSHMRQFIGFKQRDVLLYANGNLVISPHSKKGFLFFSRGKKKLETKTRVISLEQCEFKLIHKNEHNPRILSFDVVPKGDPQQTIVLGSSNERNLRNWFQDIIGVASVSGKGGGYAQGHERQTRVVRNKFNASQNAIEVLRAKEAWMQAFFEMHCDAVSAPLRYWNEEFSVTALQGEVVPGFRLWRDFGIFATQYVLETKTFVSSTKDVAAHAASKSDENKQIGGLGTSMFHVFINNSVRNGTGDPRAKSSQSVLFGSATQMARSIPDTRTHDAMQLFYDTYGVLLIMDKNNNESSCSMQISTQLQINCLDGGSYLVSPGRPVLLDNDLQTVPNSPLNSFTSIFTRTLKLGRLGFVSTTLIKADGSLLLLSIPAGRSGREAAMKGVLRSGYSGNYVVTNCNGCRFHHLQPRQDSTPSQDSDGPSLVQNRVVSWTVGKKVWGNVIMETRMDSNDTAIFQECTRGAGFLRPEYPSYRTDLLREYVIRLSKAKRVTLVADDTASAVGSLGAASTTDSVLGSQFGGNAQHSSPLSAQGSSSSSHQRALHDCSNVLNELGFCERAVAMDVNLRLVFAATQRIAACSSLIKRPQQLVLLLHQHGAELTTEAMRVLRTQVTPDVRAIIDNEYFLHFFHGNIFGAALYLSSRMLDGPNWTAAEREVHMAAARRALALAWLRTTGGVVKVSCLLEGVRQRKPLLVREKGKKKKVGVGAADTNKEISTSRRSAGRPQELQLDNDEIRSGDQGEGTFGVDPRELLSSVTSLKKLSSFIDPLFQGRLRGYYSHGGEELYSQRLARGSTRFSVVDQTHPELFKAHPVEARDPVVLAATLLNKSTYFLQHNQARLERRPLPHPEQAIEVYSSMVSLVFRNAEIEYEGACRTNLAAASAAGLMGSEISKPKSRVKKRNNSIHSISENDTDTANINKQFLSSIGGTTQFVSLKSNACSRGYVSDNSETEIRWIKWWHAMLPEEKPSHENKACFAWLQVALTRARDAYLLGSARRPKDATDHIVDALDFAESMLKSPSSPMLAPCAFMRAALSPHVAHVVLAVKLAVGPMRSRVSRRWIETLFNWLLVMPDSEFTGNERKTILKCIEAMGCVVTRPVTRWSLIRRVMLRKNPMKAFLVHTSMTGSSSACSPETERILESYASHFPTRMDKLDEEHNTFAEEHTIHSLSAVVSCVVATLSKAQTSDIHLDFTSATFADHRQGVLDPLSSARSLADSDDESIESGREHPWAAGMDIPVSRSDNRTIAKTDPKLFTGITSGTMLAIRGPPCGLSQEEELIVSRNNHTKEKGDEIDNNSDDGCQSGNQLDDSMDDKLSIGLGSYRRRDGKLDLSFLSVEDVFTEVLLPHRLQIKGVSCGQRHTAIVTEGGALLTFGEGGGLLGHSSMDATVEPTVVRFFAERQCFVQSATCGNKHTVAVCIEDSGRVGVAYAWGWGEAGRLGQGRDLGTEPLPLRIDTYWDSSTGTGGSNENIKGHGNLKAVRADVVEIAEVACGYEHTLLLSTKGEVFACGAGDCGRLGLGDEMNRLAPTRVLGNLEDEAVIAVAAGDLHSLAVSRDGVVLSWGLGEFGALGHGDTLNRFEPKRVALLQDSRQVRNVGCGSNHSVALDTEGRVWAWGDKSNGHLGTVVSTTSETGSSSGVPGEHCVPRMVRFGGVLTEDGGSTRIDRIVCGPHTTAAVDTKERVFLWGAPAGMDASDGALLIPTRTFERFKGTATVAVGSFHVVAVFGGQDLDQNGNDGPARLISQRTSSFVEDLTSLVPRMATMIPSTGENKRRFGDDDDHNEGKPAYQKNIETQPVEPQLRPPPSPATGNSAHDGHSRLDRECTLFCGSLGSEARRTARSYVPEQVALHKDLIVLGFYGPEAPTSLLVRPCAKIRFDTPEPIIDLNGQRVVSAAGDAMDWRFSTSERATFTWGASMAQAEGAMLMPAMDFLQLETYGLSTSMSGTWSGALVRKRVVNYTRSNVNAKRNDNNFDNDSNNKAVLSTQVMLWRNGSCGGEELHNKDRHGLELFRPPLVWPNHDDTILVDLAVCNDHILALDKDGSVYEFSSRMGNEVRKAMDIALADVHRRVSSHDFGEPGRSKTQALEAEQELVERVTRFYLKYCPDKVCRNPNFLATILRLYQDDTNKLLTELIEKYGPEPKKQEANCPTGFMRDYPVLLSMPGMDIKVVQVACNQTKSLALTEDGAVFEWGFNPTAGGMSLLHFPSGSRVKRGNSTRIARVATGSTHSLAMSLGGALFSWGNGAWGKLGHGDCAEADAPKQVRFFQDNFSPPVLICKVAAGWRHSAVVTTCGKAFTFGYSATSALGLGKWSELPTVISTPRLVESLLPRLVTNVFAGCTSTVFTTTE